MKYISAVIQLDPDAPYRCDKEVNQIFQGPRRQLLEIKLQNGAVLTRHRAHEPITVLCLAGRGRFFAGEELEDIQEMRPGTLSIMPAGLDEQLSKQELADLIAFLRAAK